VSLIGISIAILLQGCGIYSFTGASIAPDIKSIHIAYFENQASLVNSQLSQQFTQRMRDKFNNETNLIITDNDTKADVIMRGFISNYAISSVASQANETAAQSRLSISVSVEYANTKNDKQNYTQTFTRFADYSNTALFESVEKQLIDDINLMLVDDIFNRTFANW
jgi:outer membrane lipopolysaccharide assembly protein LptE/RlpB